VGESRVATPGVVMSERRLIKDNEDLFRREVLRLSSGVVVGDDEEVADCESRSTC